MLEIGDIPVEELWLDFKDTTNEITEPYRDKERLMKKAIRTYMRQQLDDNIQVMEEDFKKNNLGNL